MAGDPLISFTIMLASGACGTMRMPLLPVRDLVATLIVDDKMSQELSGRLPLAS